MNVLRFTDKDFAQRLAGLGQLSSLFDKQIEERTQTILEAVRTGGDNALLELTQRFDGAKLTIELLAVSAPELLDASLEADSELRKALGTAAMNIALFSR